MSAPAAHSSGSDDHRSHGLQVLDLSMSNPALLDIKGPESLSSLWGVLTRCKRSLKDGERLENISWRLWYQACVNASVSHGRTQSALDTTHPLTPSSSRDGMDAGSSGESEGWTSDSAASSDEDVAEQEESRTNEKTSEAAHEPSDAEGEDDQDYVTESEAPESPETPPPHPLPTRPSVKATTSTQKARGKASAAKGKKAVLATHGRQKSVGEASGAGKKRSVEVEKNMVERPGLASVFKQSSQSSHASSTANATSQYTKPAERSSATIAPIAAPKHVSSTAYSSSTPKASSYPTPSASYVPSQAHSGASSATGSAQPPPGIARSRSHLEPGARHSHSGHVGTVWGQWRRAGERSFGEVVDDVFRVVRVEDLVPKRTTSRDHPTPGLGEVRRELASARDTMPANSVTSNVEPKKASLGNGGDSGVIAWDSLSGTASTKPVRILQEEISPRTTPGVQTVYHESPLQMPVEEPDSQPPVPSETRSSSMEEVANISNTAIPTLAPSMGPIVRVVEPTPAPSRVGSAGELSPLGGRLLASNAINHGFSRLKKKRQQPAEVVARLESAADNEVNGIQAEIESSTGASESAWNGTKPPSARRTSSARSNRSGISSGAYSPTVEIDNPMESVGTKQAFTTSPTTKGHETSPQLSSSVVQRLNDSATARPHKSSSKQAKQAEHQAQLQAQQSAKKNKKSIFFIQSPGDNRSRRSGGRHGSISGGSEASTDPDGGSFAGSSVGAAAAGSAKSPARNRSTSSGAATSPLAQEVVRPGIEERLVETSARSDRTKPPSEATNASQAPPEPSRAVSDSIVPPTNRRASGGSRTSGGAGMKRTSSTAHANAHGGHARRPSVHQMTHTTTGHAKNHTTTAANAGAAKRTDSMSNMAGRLREMKANAAAAISARLAAQQKAEKERLSEQRNKLLASKRQRSEPDMLAAQQRLIAEAEQDQDGSENDDDDDYEDVDDDTAAGEEEEDDDAWSSATDESAKGAGLVIGKVKPKPKRDPAAAAAAKALAAEEDAKRKRELFAKRAIFGSGGMSGLSTVTPIAPRANTLGELNPATGGSKPGLLTNLFEKQRDVLRRGDSMVSLIEPSHSVPPRVHATEGTRQREGHTPNLGFNFMNRSKSSAALPIASGISVTTGGLINAGQSLSPAKDTETKTTPIRGKLRLPPKPAEDAEFSPSSSPENTSSMLATSEAVRRLEALSTKRRPSARSNLSQETTEHAVAKSFAETQETAPSTSTLTAALERTQSHPMPVQQHSVQFVEPALPQTPTTRRRQMLATELPEDLRMNLLFERKSRAAVYPKSNLRATASVHDLPEAGRESEFSSTEMSRQTSHNPSDEVASKREVSPNSAAQPPARRRSGPNLLSGGNLLRPLTSASAANVARGQAEANSQEPSQSAVRQPLQRDQRSKSSVNVSDLTRVDAHRGVGFGGWGGPDFKRRSTDGDNRDASAAEQRLARLKALREREGELSSSFRSHGW